ncbi:MAG: amidohydrolase [Candidatus Marinimicrobia bacterium]|nr:amidohydrolase [Candidatus Neomarinimicrobiota bacterium]
MKSPRPTQTEPSAARPRFPVIDAHNHLWAAWENVDEVARVMDTCGVRAYADLTANVSLRFADGGYVIGPGSFADFLAGAARRHPGRFYGFTTACFCQPPGVPLCADVNAFVEESVAVLTADVAQGARGLKILKEFGLHYRDAAGALLRTDDRRFDPLWAACARLDVPVLIHQADPAGFFRPPTPDNEHADSLRKYPAWSFADPRFPRHEELLARLDRLVAQNPRTVFLLPHCINWPENLPWVADFLDRHPNARMDFSARCDDLGRQPEAARAFLIRYEDRIYFGTDMPASVAMYAFHWRFLETGDRDLVPPDYDGTFGRYRWKVRGLALPDRTLRKIYHQNALAWIPGLKEEVNIT